MKMPAAKAQKLVGKADALNEDVEIQRHGTVKIWEQSDGTKKKDLGMKAREPVTKKQENQVDGNREGLEQEQTEKQTKM